MPAGITSGLETLSSVPGQVAVLSAVNMAARVHPGLVLALPEAPLLVTSPAGGSTVMEACSRLAVAARPEIRITISDHIPTDIPSMGIGIDAGQASIYAGGHRWTGSTEPYPVALTAHPSSLLGAGIAVTHAAAAIFRLAIGRPARMTTSLSLWDLADTATPTGPAALDPIDVGTTWLIGAGAVGSCLAWWLSFAGVMGMWTIIDPDIVDITNLNRALGLFAWDAGLKGAVPAQKAEAAARLIPGAEPFSDWLTAWFELDRPAPDVFIPVANDQGVRPATATYGHPAVLHATTSPNWSAELHRHLLEADDCIACRIPENAPRFACASDSDDESGPRKPNDAALPFLSAASGLLLVSGLVQLQLGRWTSHPRNHWRLFFDESAAAVDASRWVCNQSCSAVPPAPIRRLIHGHTRWAGLDPEHAG